MPEFDLGPDRDELERLLGEKGLKPLYLETPDGCYVTYKDRRFRLFCQDVESAKASIAVQVGCNPYVGELIDKVLASVRRIYGMLQSLGATEEVLREYEELRRSLEERRRELEELKGELVAPALVVYFRLPHEYSRDMGGRFEYADGGRRVTLTVDPKAENILVKARNTLAMYLQKAGCFRWETGFYVCPPASIKEVYEARRKVSEKLSLLGEKALNKFMFRVERVLFKPESLIELVESALQEAEEELKAKEAKIAELQEKGKNANIYEYRRQASTLKEKIEKLQTFLKQLKQMTAQRMKEGS